MENFVIIILVKGEIEFVCTCGAHVQTLGMAGFIASSMTSFEPGRYNTAEHSRSLPKAFTEFNFSSSK